MKPNNKKNKYRKAVFAVIYKKQNGKIFYLILKRKKHWIGWEFTKGGVEEGETTVATVKREVREESGLKPSKIKKFNVIGKYKYSSNFKDRPGFIGQSYKLFATEIKDNGGKVKPRIDKKEHSGYKWLEFSEAKEILTWKNQKKCLKIVDKFLNK